MSHDLLPLHRFLPLLGLETVIPPPQGRSSKQWVAAGLEDGRRPAEQLLEAERAELRTAPASASFSAYLRP